MALVVALHVAAVWTLITLPFHKITVGDAVTMEMRFELAPPPQPALSLPEMQPIEPVVEAPRPEPPQYEVPAPPLPPDPTSSEFLKEASSPPPSQPPLPKPRQVAALQAPPATPSEASPQELPSEQTTGHRIMKQSDLVAIEPIKLRYPPNAVAARHWGVAGLRVLLDVEGRPSEVWLTTTTHHSELDDEAVRAIKAARFKPYTTSGGPETVWVDIVALFVLVEK
jgi:protein TonB